MMSTFWPRSSSTFSSSTLMKVTGYSGGAAGAAPASSTPHATTAISAHRIPLSPRPPARGSASPPPPLPEPLGLHRLALAAVRDREQLEVGGDRVHVHEVVARVGGDAAVAVEAAQLAVPDLVGPPRREGQIGG